MEQDMPPSAKKGLSQWSQLEGEGGRRMRGLRVIQLALLVVSAAYFPGVSVRADGLSSCGTTATPPAGSPPGPALVAASPSPDAGSVLNVVADIPLPGGATRFDYLSL